MQLMAATLENAAPDAEGSATSAEINWSDMGLRLQRFRRSLGGCDTTCDVSDLFGETLAGLFLTAHACGAVSRSRGPRADPFHFVHWPAGWLAQYRAQGYADIDPATRWAAVSGLPTLLSDMVRQLPGDDRGHEVVRAAAEWGLREGFVTPVRAADGSLGVVSVAGSRGRLTEVEKTFLPAISTAAFHRKEAISGGRLTEYRTDLFSNREQECITLLAKGFTDRELGSVLGIAESTARFHLDNARRKVGARSRAQLVALATAL
jgi:LuxR family quorum sensing-dependent transcriptional regulator